MPIAYASTRVRRKPVPRETRVPTAMPALDRIRLERWAGVAGRVAGAAPAAAAPGGRRRGPRAARVVLGARALAAGRRRREGGLRPGPQVRAGGRYPVVRGTRRQPGGASTEPGGAAR